MQLCTMLDTACSYHHFLSDSSQLYRLSFICHDVYTNFLESMCLHNRTHTDAQQQHEHHHITVVQWHIRWGTGGGHSPQICGIQFLYNIFKTSENFFLCIDTLQYNRLLVISYLVLLMQVCRQESKYAGMHVHMVDKTEPKVPPPHTPA